MNEERRPSISELMANAELVTAAIQRAVREAVLEHARAGNPVATSRDGKVVWITPEEILTSFADPKEPKEPPAT
jgi:hypothetical protein